MRRLSLAVALFLCTGIAQAQATDASRKLAQSAVIVDTHIDAPGELMDAWRDLATETDREFDWPKARAGGLDIAFMSVYTSPKQDADGSAFHIANQQIDAVMALAARELATKLNKIEHLNVTPDLLASLVDGFQKTPPAVAVR